MNNPLAGGLGALEAAQRLQQEGPNELPRGARRTLWRIVLEALRDPMSQFLLAGVAIYLLLGDVHEALVLGVFVCVTIGLSVVQQQRTELVAKKRPLERSATINDHDSTIAGCAKSLFEQGVVLQAVQSGDLSVEYGHLTEVTEQRPHGPYLAGMVV